MKQILWFRRDLRVADSAILAHAKGEVLPIFIFDTDILSSLSKDDKRVTFIFNSVMRLKHDLKLIGLDLAVFYGRPKDVISSLVKHDFDAILCSVDFDSYAIKRDKEIDSIIPMSRFIDSFILNPMDHLKIDGKPYRVFTPFYKSLFPIWQSDKMELFTASDELNLYDYDFESTPELKDMGFNSVELVDFLYHDPFDVLEDFIPKLQRYKEDRDFWNIEATSNMSVFLRFGLISPKQIFNAIRKVDGGDFYIRELFWREFYNYILYHYPDSEHENFQAVSPKWNNDKNDFEKWKNGQTGVPIVDAAIRHLNRTGMMHNRLRMVISSYLTKNLLIDWRWGEEYFAQKLLDYEASSNIGSWQWAASTGADAVPYFRIFNPYTQSIKFDEEARFIKENIPELRDVSPKEIHRENLAQNLLSSYPAPTISIKDSRQRALGAFR